MIAIKLFREETSDQGTFGRLFIDGRFFIFMAEPPWRGNRTGLSCIPPGDYEVEPWNSRRFPRTYRVRNVLHRDAILIHPGNLAGDPEKGFVRHTLGCLLPGLNLGFIGKQRAVLLSISAMNALREMIGASRFRLSIEGDGPWNG